MKKSILSSLVCLMLISGCASKNITPQYVNPTNYQAYDCGQLQAEVDRVTKLVEQTQKQQVGLSSTGIGIGISGGSYGIFPTISLGVGSSGNERNARNNALAKLYGEHDAMIVSARQKGCAFAQGIKIYGE